MASLQFESATAAPRLFLYNRPTATQFRGGYEIISRTYGPRIVESSISSYPNLVLTEDQVKNLCLREIEHVMQQRGISLRGYPSMPYPEHVDIVGFGNQLISHELAYDRDTFVWKTLSAAIRSRGGIVLNIASSGIASLLLPGGRTAHSRFTIPLNLNEISTCNIKQPSELAELIEKTDLTIWDEAPMMNSFVLKLLIEVCGISCLIKDLKHIIRFGGKVIIFGGDFRQILHVVPTATRQDIVRATISSSPIWRHCKVLRLTKNMRLQNCSNGDDLDDLRSFSNWLTSIGDGTLCGDNDGEIDIQIPNDLLINESNVLSVRLLMPLT
ncbi:hypothetical protein OROHE_025018 [Orobanche hederae]